MVATALTGKQAALMVPTEILAEQHMLTIEKLIQGTPLKAVLLTGSMNRSQKKRKRVAHCVESGGEPCNRDTCFVPTRCEL